jgi:hypothetical protein
MVFASKPIPRLLVNVEYPVHSCYSYHSNEKYN